jgi:lysophospholipase L1-like esterase
MKATNGLVVLFRSRTRLIGCSMAIALMLSALAFASTAGAAKTPKPETYLALGDSLAFGYSQQLYNENEAAGDPATAFENGYASDYYEKVKAKAMHKGLLLTNDGCPGETTESLIGSNPALIGGLNAALKAAQEANKLPPITGESPCAYQEAWNAFHTNGKGGPLHHPYVGQSQLENALETIALDNAFGKPVTHITLNIGANDELHVVNGCKAEVTEEFINEGKSKYGATPTTAVKGCLEFHVPGLFGQILSNISGMLAAIRNGASFVPGGVNYTGAIVVQGGYDPYGNVLGEGELLESSNGLAALLNEHEAATVAAFGACYANPQPKFDPQNKREPGQLQRWTNMANITEFEGKANGPDIHPTPEGYQELAKIMKADCGVS